MINGVSNIDKDKNHRNKDIQKQINKLNSESKLFRLILEEYIRRNGGNAENNRN